MMRTCGKCGLEIHDSESGVRHFGHFTAHQEDRCLDLLRQQLEQSQARVSELEAALKKIGFMGGDCPAEMPEGAFYRGQFYDAVATASAALAEG